MRKSQVKYLDYAKLVKERLSLLIEKITDGNQTKFAISIDATSPTITEWLGNIKKSIPSAYYMIRICEVHNVNINWLLTGKGEIFNQPEQKKTIQPYPEEKRQVYKEPCMAILEHMILKLNPDERKRLIKMVAVCFDQELIDCEHNEKPKEVEK